MYPVFCESNSDDRRVEASIDLCLVCLLQPFRAHWDNWLWVMGLGAVLFTVYLGQLMKLMDDARQGLPLGLSEEGAVALLITVNVSLVLMAVVATALQFAEETRVVNGDTAHLPTVVVPTDSRPAAHQEPVLEDAERKSLAAVSVTGPEQASARGFPAGAQRRASKRRTSRVGTPPSVQGVQDALRRQQQDLTPVPAPASSSGTPAPAPEPFLAFFDEQPSEAQVDSSLNLEQYLGLDIRTGSATMGDPAVGRVTAPFEVLSTQQTGESKKDRLEKEQEHGAQGESKQESQAAAAAGVATHQDGNNDPTPEASMGVLLGLPTGDSESVDKENPDFAAKASAKGDSMARSAKNTKAHRAQKKSMVL